MICIYYVNCTGFDSNGLGLLCPSTCEVMETLNGEYELEMEHSHYGFHP